MHRVPNVNGSKEAVYNPNSQLYSNEKRMINQWTLGVPYFPTNQCIRRYSWCENWGIRVTGHTARGNTWFQSQHTWGWPVYVLEVEHARIPTIWMLTQLTRAPGEKTHGHIDIARPSAQHGLTAHPRCCWRRPGVKENTDETATQREIRHFQLLE